jgi:AcrR family transcriptional regulator
MLMPGGKARTAAADTVSKEMRLLEAAAQEFNTRGIAGASIARIARAMGLTRAAVYYYVKDRDALASLCYAQTCAVMRSDLDIALKQRAKGLDKLLVFLRFSLDPKRAPVAALSELDYFTGRRRTEIAAAHARNVETLRGLIRDGVADGSIRPCDDEIMAQTIIGIIMWIPLSVAWVEGTDETFRPRTAEAFCDFVVNGQAADRDFQFESPVDIETFFPGAPHAFDREANAAAKVEQMLMTASRLFNRRGIDGTSLDDVMAALGATKGTLYHYLDNKTDLVARCHKRAYSLYEQFADAAEKYGRSGLERGLIGTYLNVQAHARELSPLVQMAGVGALPAAVKRDTTKRSRILQKRFRQFGVDGLADGSFRTFDFDSQAQFGAGAFEWLPKWFRADDPRAKLVLAREIVTLFIRGLRA